MAPESDVNAHRVHPSTSHLPVLTSPNGVVVTVCLHSNSIFTVNQKKCLENLGLSFQTTSSWRDPAVSFTSYFFYTWTCNADGLRALSKMIIKSNAWHHEWPNGPQNFAKLYMHGQCKTSKYVWRCMYLILYYLINYSHKTFYVTRLECCTRHWSNKSDSVYIKTPSTVLISVGLQYLIVRLSVCFPFFLVKNKIHTQQKEQQTENTHSTKTGAIKTKVLRNGCCCDQTALGRKGRPWHLSVASCHPEPMRLRYHMSSGFRRPVWGGILPSTLFCFGGCFIFIFLDFVNPYPHWLKKGAHQALTWKGITP